MSLDATVDITYEYADISSAPSSKSIRRINTVTEVREPSGEGEGSQQVYMMTASVVGGGSTTWVVRGTPDFLGVDHPNITQHNLNNITLIG